MVQGHGLLARPRAAASGFKRAMVTLLLTHTRPLGLAPYYTAPTPEVAEGVREGDKGKILCFPIKLFIHILTTETARRDMREETKM